MGGRLKSQGSKSVLFLQRAKKKKKKKGGGGVGPGAVGGVCDVEKRAS